MGFGFVLLDYPGVMIVAKNGKLDGPLEALGCRESFGVVTE